jgi:hypothetical protein
MSIQWNIYINSTQVDEPKGWSDISINVKRDEQWHGVFFEASTTSLTFYGAGAALLQTEKQANGLAASATFRAEAVCGETIDVLQGNFDFGTYSEKCGNDCAVEISIERSGCTMTLRNRYDQAVDLSKTTAFDNMTLLPAYTGLNMGIELTAQQLLLINEAYITDAAVSAVISDDLYWGDCTGFNQYEGYMTIPTPDVKFESLGVFNPAYTPELSECGTTASNHPPYPDTPTTTGTADLTGVINCDLQDTEIEYRVKGTVNATMSGGGPPGVFGTVRIIKLPKDADPIFGWVILESVTLFSLNASGTVVFDQANTVPLTMEAGDFIYWGIRFNTTRNSQISNCNITFDVGTFFKLSAAATCESSNADTSLINEAGARIVESITDSCLTFKSDYYGRTDSQPYASTQDGCGGLRVISNGLKIRNAETSNHFISLQDFFAGLRGIDNIGIGIEPNTVTNLGEWLRMEPAEYFYQDVLLLTLPYIPEAVSKLEPTMAYSKVNIGYQKWEVEKVNGLNEFNSNKEFRTSLSTINSTLDALSNFVAGGIPIEVTRQQSFAVSGAADTKYDNDTFIICVTREGVYSVQFFASGNHMVFETSGDGSEFLIAGITIAGSTSNDGTRVILSTSISNLPNNRSLIDITFTGGATIDEVSDTVTFTGITSSGIFVEKNNITSPANIYSPSTAYNWRIRPFYNLMRWFKSIAQCYVNLSNTTSKLFFGKGTGNYIAEGRLTTPDSCALENGVYAENTDLTDNMYVGAGGVPIFKPETIQFTYPLSVAEYITIKNNPYGYLNIQCGNGNFEKAFIKSVEYKPVLGQAVFTLILKWQ